MKADYGFSDLMVTAAFRYCLGRRTYIVSECASWLIRIWPQLGDNCKHVIKRDLEEAFTQDDRKDGPQSDYKRLGDQCDRESWETVRSLWTTHHPSADQELSPSPAESPQAVTGDSPA